MGLARSERGGAANGRHAIGRLSQANEQNPSWSLRPTAEVERFISACPKVPPTQTPPDRSAKLLIEGAHLWRKNAIGPEPDGEERRVERR
jgi:hypothetical protein